MDSQNKPKASEVVKRLIAEDGWKGLYRGLGPRFFSSSAWGTSMIVCYEYLSMFISPCQIYTSICSADLLVSKSLYPLPNDIHKHMQCHILLQLMQINFRYMRSSHLEFRILVSFWSICIVSPLLL